MVTVTITQNLQRHAPCPVCEVAPGSVRSVLDAVFARYPATRGYVVDEHGQLRRHMNIFVNGEPIGDRAALHDHVPDGAEVFVMQALSGG